MENKHKRAQDLKLLMEVDDTFINLLRSNTFRMLGGAK